jgi:hypothetical protein
MDKRQEQDKLYAEMQEKTRKVSDEFFIDKKIDWDTHNKKQQEITDWYKDKLKILFSSKKDVC